MWTRRPARTSASPAWRAVPGATTPRARGSPAVLRIVEILGMVQAREWGVGTMNEFRDFLGLKRFGSFEEWNKDPEIAVRTLFGVELLVRACRC